MVRQYAACLHNQNLFICIVRFNGEKNDLKNGREKSRKMRNNWKWFLFLGGVLYCRSSIQNTSFNFFRHDFEKNRRYKKKLRRNPIYIHGVWFFFFFFSRLHLFVVVVCFVCQLCLASLWIWPSFRQWQQQKKMSHLVSIKWFDSPSLNEWTNFFSNKRQKTEEDEIHATKLFGYNIY